MTKTIIFMCVIDFLPSCVLNRIHVLHMYDVIWTENNRVSSTRKREANLHIHASYLQELVYPQ